MINTLKEGISKNIISLLLCVSIVSSCMYVYSRTWMPLFIIITFVIQASVFSFYTYLSKKSMLLRFISVLGSFFAICTMVMIAIKTGHNKSSVEYFVWFLSPQALVEFSFSYIIATFITINFFIASTVYYFSAVRYRISMTFLITLIPFAFYRKEDTPVPVSFALLLLIMYIALMIHCRQLNTKPNQKLIMDSGYKKSIVCFLAASTFLTLIIPKPNINIDNQWVSTLFESESLSNYMLSKLGIVSDTSVPLVTYTNASDTKLFEFIADEEPINLKSQTYSIYNYKENAWHTGKDETKGRNITDTNAEALDPTEFYKAVASACVLDEKFAADYGLYDMENELSEDYKRSVSMINSVIPTKYFFTPVLSFGVTGRNADKVYRSDNGMLFADFNSGNKYTVNYYSSASAFDENYLKILSSLDFEHYDDFLIELWGILGKNEVSEYIPAVTAYYDDYLYAKDYISEYTADVPENVSEIAENIVNGCSSDIEKAYAIQEYFRTNGYVYDLEYRKPAEYDIEYFLTKGKTGICSDYATSMVLLARSAGIPARYAEGVHLHDPDEATGIITVKDTDLHAFPELFIAGYGWMSFEPTQVQEAVKPEDNSLVVSICILLSAVLVFLLVLIFVKYIHPALSEYFFRKKIKKSSNEKAIELIMNRIRKISCSDSSFTSGEVSELLEEDYGIVMDSTVSDFDSVVYGSMQAGSSAAADAFGIYTALYDRIAENRKRKNK